MRGHKEREREKKEKRKREKKKDMVGEQEREKEKRTYGKASQTTMCRVWCSGLLAGGGVRDVAKGGCLSGTRRGSLWTCRVEGVREYEEGNGGHGGEEGRVHTLSERRTVAAGRLRGDGRNWKQACWLVSTIFVYIYTISNSRSGCLVFLCRF